MMVPELSQCARAATWMHRGGTGGSDCGRYGIVEMANCAAACKNSPACAPAKHHFDECVERVTKAIDEEGSANEDCVEECTSRFSITYPTPSAILQPSTPLPIPQEKQATRAK